MVHARHPVEKMRHHRRARTDRGFDIVTRGRAVPDGDHDASIDELAHGRGGFGDLRRERHEPDDGRQAGEPIQVDRGE